MIVTHKPLNVENATGNVSSNFSIKASKEAFAILSSGLYSDKVKATIRELSTNAADSHVAAGKAGVPFTVHLPNSLEPYFSVKDEGTGLTESQLTSLYTTYFDSNKSNSNDFTGCLGLGSKSPFSYTQQFTVESRVDGKKYTYNAFIDKTGLPSIVKMGECDTTELNGLEVKFAVKSSDFWEFCSKAQDALSWFKVRPKVTGNASFEFTDNEYLRQTPNYALVKGKRYHSFVVMGNVAYAVEPHEIKNTKVILTAIERKVLEWGVDIFVPIGTVDITANREKISYDDDSVAAIKTCLAVAIEDIKTEVEKQISGAPTLCQARRTLHEARHSIIGQVKELLEVKYQGKDLLDHVNAKMFIKDGETPPTLQKLTCRKTNFKKSFCDTIPADGRPIFVNDIGHGGYARVTAHLNGKSQDNAYLISGADKEWLVATGLNEVALYTSTMPKPERTKTNVPRRKGSKAMINELVPTGNHRQCADYWKGSEVDMEDGGVYVEIVYYRYKDGNEEPCHPSVLQKTYEQLKSLGAETSIYGVRPADVANLQKHEGWMTLKEHIKNVLEEHMDEFKDKLAAWDDWTSCGTNYEKTGKLCNQKFLKGSKYGEFLGRLKIAHDASTDSKVRVFANLASKIGMKLEKKKEDLELLRDATRKMYPLLNHLNWWDCTHGDGLNAVMGYINLVDSSLGCEGTMEEYSVVSSSSDDEEEEAA